MLEVQGAMVVARELKRPLLELRQLALGFDGSGPEDERIRAEMVAVSERAMRQVDDLARFEKLANGGYEMGPIAVRALCDDVLEEVQGLFGGKKCEMEVKYSNRLRLVNANAELLKSVILNLLLNAIEYEDKEMKTSLLVSESKGKVEIKVRDFGPAITSEVWREVKTEMSKPKEIAMRPGSSALGFYIASKFSKYMKAEVGAVRHSDGVSFFIKLPTARQMSIWGF
ncbi:HAMP domain-containing histidine kinase [Candidatus Saccharibacteria bacterium]|nr:HAMP domain-containing histidine kinase [Candidatus Saccharibacteria bacterium]